jgi:carboxylate-amine ligase
VDHAFGRGTPFRLGMEEELLLVDAATLEANVRSSRLLPAVTVPDGGKAMHDVYEPLVELASPVVDDAEDGARELHALREAVRGAGATLLGAGLHPTAAFGAVEHVDEPRYADIGDQMRGLLRRTPTCALHVHVGMPDPETAIACSDRLRHWLPVFQALAAHSPYWHGLDSGFETARAQHFRGYPRGTIPPAFGTWDAYEAFVGQWTRAADVPDYTYLWWDLRLHPKLGTLELRAMDAQASLGAVAGLSALAHGLVQVLAERDPGPPDALHSDVLMESSFRAGRDGLDATIWWDGALRPVRELAAQAIGLARAGGAGPALEEAERLLRDGNGARAMRAAHRAGGMRRVLEDLRDAALRPPGARPAAPSGG